MNYWKEKSRQSYSRKLMFGEWVDKVCCVCGDKIGQPIPKSLAISNEVMCFGCPEPKEKEK